MARPGFSVFVIALAVIGAACSTTAQSATTSAAPATTTAVVATTPPSTTSAPPTTAVPGVQPSSPEAELDAALEAWLAEDEALGVVATVVGPDGFRWTGTRGLADRIAGTPVPADGLFEIGSVTKPMVAAAALSLAEDGAIDLDAAVDVYLPDRGLEGTTLRALLAHTAGLDDVDAAGSFVGTSVPDLERAVPSSELVDAAVELVPADPAGTFSYSNAGYWLVGGVIEAATGEPLTDVIRSRVIDVAELTDTHLAWEEPLPRELVIGYFDVFGTGNEIGLGTKPIPAMITGAWAAGGVVATAADVAMFFDALFDGLIVADVASMLDGGVSTEHGLGLSKTFFPGGEAWGHNGGIPGYTSSAYHDLETGFSVAVMTNRFGLGGPDTEQLAGTLLGALRPTG